MRLLLASVSVALLVAATANAQYDNKTTQKKKSEMVYTATILGVGG